MEKILRKQQKPALILAASVSGGAGAAQTEQTPGNILPGVNDSTANLVKDPNLDFPPELTQTLATLEAKGSTLHIDPKETRALQMSQNNRTMSMPDALEKTHDSIGEAHVIPGAELSAIKHSMGSEGRLPASSQPHPADVVTQVSPTGTFRDQNSFQKSCESPLGPTLGPFHDISNQLHHLVKQETVTGAQHKQKIQKARKDMLSRVVPLQISPGNDPTQRNIIQAQLQATLTAADLNNNGFGMSSLQERQVLQVGRDQSPPSVVSPGPIHGGVSSNSPQTITRISPKLG